MDEREAMTQVKQKEINKGFEKCPYCGAWYKTQELYNHIGVCFLYNRKNKRCPTPKP